MHMRKLSRVFVVLGLVALVAAAVAYGANNRKSASDTLVFASSADPVALDGALISDGESGRVVIQIYEGLVSLKPGTTIVEPSLATKWKASPSGKVWTFTLRPNVKFSDGTPMNAAAVCFNFNRWYNFKGSFQNPSATYYWQTVFGGFKTYDPKSGAPKGSLFSSCQATAPLTAQITLTSASASFLGALSLPSFFIGSPTAEKKYGADKGSVDASGVFHPTGTYATAHPTGTGPFMLQSWTRGDKLVLVRNPNYWGKKAILKTLIFRPIADNAARLQALQNGEIQGYDLVEPEDVATIKSDSNLQLLSRPPFNVGIVGMNQSMPPMNNLKVRQAVAYGLDRATVVKAFYGGRGVVAKEFQPPSLFGYSNSVKQYPYDPAKSKALLKAAGLKLPVTINFWYPTSVSRPYMPDPVKNFQAFSASLTKAGFKVVPHAAPWNPDYLGGVQAGKAQVFLYGWTGDYGDPDDFDGVFFRTPQKQWGFNNKAIFNILTKARDETSIEKRVALYKQANNMIMDFLPGVPYVHTSPALAFDKNVKGYIPSPVDIQLFSGVSIG
jgi:peptide/nickel transport system substrate-binding protein